MNYSKRIVAGFMLGGLLAAGCMKDKSASPSAASTMLKDADLTHVITKDAVLYKSPTAGAAPVKSVKGSTKVLVLIPGSEYTQVELADGTMGYVSTEALEAVAPATPTPPPMPKLPGKPSSMPMMMPTTKPATSGESPAPTAPMMAKPGPAPVAPAVTPPAPPPKETHVLTKEQPFFSAIPGPDAKPAGMLPAGTKVLLVIPGSDYAQVETTDGKSVFTPTEGLDAIPTK